MKRLLLGAMATLAALALTGGAASAGAYTFPDESEVSGGTFCAAAVPRLVFEIDFTGAKTTDLSYSLRFVRDGSPFASPVPVPGPSGEIPFPVETTLEGDGWVPLAGTDLFDPGTDVLGIRLIGQVTDAGDGGAVYTSEPRAITLLNPQDCVAAQPPPPQPPPPQPPTPQPPPPQPPTPTPTPPLPSTGISTFETSLRIGALLMIGGLGFVIVARRRRFAANV